MPKDSEDVVETDEELEALKAELEKERAKYAAKKPEEQATASAEAPKTQPEPQAKPTAPMETVQAAPEALAKPPEKTDETGGPPHPTSDESLDNLRAELAKERLKYSLQATEGMTVQKPPEPDEELVNLEAELEKTAQRKTPEPQAKEPAKTAVITKPEAPAKTPYAEIQKPTTKPPVITETKTNASADSELEELKAELEKAKQGAPKPQEKKEQLAGTSKTEAPRKPLPPELARKPQEKKIRPALEPLHEDLFDDMQSEPTARKPPGKTPYVAIILFIVLALAAIVAYTLMQEPDVRESYQCLDGSWVEDRTLCPPTTTTRPTPTTEPPFTMPPATTMETTTTTLESACSKNGDCERPIPYVPYCDGKIVRNPDVKFTCLHGGTPDAYCQAITAPPKFIKACEDSQYCWLGECYPEHCRNRARESDKGEEKVDCGGPCRRCNSTDTLCRTGADCGRDVCATPYCNRDMNPTHNCTRYSCMDPGSPNASCQAKTTVEVIEKCGRGRMCIEGQDDCMDSGGTANCHDCVKNQGEDGVDCGGPCAACTAIPATYDRLNLTATDVIDYQRYKLKLDKLNREINCSTGAFVRATDPYGFARTYKVTAQNSAEFYDITFGFLQADTNSALIWIVKKNVM